MHLLDGIDAYLEILRCNRSPAFVCDVTSEVEREKALRQWLTENRDEIQNGLAAQRAFIAEKHALATLSGSLLQMAAMAIRLYSKNENTHPVELSDILKTNAIRYCIGRTIRQVPLGLVIYAGRNQYNHIDDHQLHEPNSTVFEWLATKHGYGKDIRDPAFDLSTGLVWNYASNVVSLIGWNTYESYEADMRSLLDP